MTLNQNLYFMSLVGALAGLASWAIGVWIPIVWPMAQENYWLAESINLVLIGLLIGAFCIAFADHWSDKGKTVMRPVVGALGGALAGILSSLTSNTIHLSLLQQNQFPWWLVTLGWLLNGAFAGATIGFIKYGFLMRRVLLSMLGGGFGAGLGGTVLHFGGEFLPYLAHAVGLVLTGGGISFGSTYAVRVLRGGALKLARMDDPHVAEVFSGKQQEWELLSNDYYLFGKALTAKVRQYIHIPDVYMANYHAYIYESNRVFYLKAHEENQDASGKPVFALNRKRRNSIIEIINAVALEDGDEILMGRTWFLFLLRGRSG